MVSNPENEHVFAGAADSSLHSNHIGNWSQAELRRFIVNLLLSDPGALPRGVGTTPQSLPSPANDGDVPIWDSSQNKWVTTTTKKESYSQLNLANSIVDADVNAAAALAISKLAGFPNTVAQVLTGAGSWLGGLSKIFDSTLGGSATSIDSGAGSIPATYAHLLVVTVVRSDRVAIAEDSALRFGAAGGALDTGNNYSWTQIPIASGAISGSQALLTSTALQGIAAAASAAGGVFGANVCFIPYYRTASQKCWLSFGGSGSNSGRVCIGQWQGSASPIDRVAVIPPVGPNLVVGSRMTIYGIGV